MTEVSVQGFMFYFLIFNHLQNQCLHYCVIQYIHEFTLFHFSPYSMFEIVYVSFYIMKFAFPVNFSNCYFCFKLCQDNYASLGDLPNRWLLILLSIFSLQLYLKKVKMAFSK